LDFLSNYKNWTWNICPTFFKTVFLSVILKNHNQKLTIIVHFYIKLIQLKGGIGHGQAWIEPSSYWENFVGPRKIWAGSEGKHFQNPPNYWILGLKSTYTMAAWVFKTTKFTKIDVIFLGSSLVKFFINFYILWYRYNYSFLVFL
jgi:hypothetical protein